MLQNRFKSKILWIGIGTQILTILIHLGVIDTGAGESLNAVLVSVCEMFVTFGILNNPTVSDRL